MRKIWLMAGMIFMVFSGFAQKNQKVAPQNWFNLDPKENKWPGVSTEKVYKELLAGKTGKTVVVAVIDGGVDIDHEDLKDAIWTNPKEIPGNGIDDDKNGYIDDIHGWNFIGGKDGTPVNFDTYELTRLYVKMKPKFQNVTSDSLLNEADKKDYKLWVEVRDDYESKLKVAQSNLERFTDLLRGAKDILKNLKTEEPTTEQLMAYAPKSKGEIGAKGGLIKIVANGKKPDEYISAVESVKERFYNEVEYYLNVKFNPRTIVGDTYEAAQQRNYGNNDVEGPDASHGTHVAGIIAAIRNNGVGMDGINTNVKIMVLRVVPDGDERDKDVANAIRYATENGASIINMSFGKSYVYNKLAVDEAVKFAMGRDVLMVHAAGNNAENNDVVAHYPTCYFDDTTVTPKGWIEVGASSWQKGKNIAGNFSNYGQTTVDVFAPGVSIYSTVPDSKYASYNGTSMACPVTAGVAALIRSYYPDLTAEQVKEIIVNSTVSVKGKVYVPDESGEKPVKAKFKKLCKTGGIVNAYKAMVLASTTPGMKITK